MSPVEFSIHQISTCCLCDQIVTAHEVREVSALLEEPLHGDAYCTTCLSEHFQLCRECSGRYTMDGLCAGCAAKEYRLTA